MKDRDRLRRKQDKLLSLAGHLDPVTTHIGPSRALPVLADLVAMIYPSFEVEIDASITTLKQQQRRHS